MHLQATFILRNHELLETLERDKEYPILTLPRTLLGDPDELCSETYIFTLDLVFKSVSFNFAIDSGIFGF